LHWLFAIVLSNFAPKLADSAARLAHSNDFVAPGDQLSGSAVLRQLLMPLKARRRFVVFKLLSNVWIERVVDQLDGTGPLPQTLIPFEIDRRSLSVSLSGEVAFLSLGAP